ncbi:DsbA family protein [Pontibaca salina]|uniref:DsbA family protein n=1 Tax=Pontibaca salina TaxID=2795731 RepID=A0A934HK15_9RHOB|nr:DsbA family protein [Pontibaca salina]MBI6629614.1 DsbA family protein [Pontibaca salina]
MTRMTVLIGAVAALALGAYLTMTSQNPPKAGNALISAAQAQGVAEVDISTIQEMTLGAEDAPVEIIEYSSYTCPHCANFHQDTFQKIKKNYIDTGKVRWTYREVYFDRFGLWASLVARCGGEERFFGISDLIFKGQENWTRAGEPDAIVDELRKIGRLAGMESDQIEACLQDGEKAQTLVAWFQKNAEADKIESTPSFVVNGSKVSNQTYADFSALIDAALE